MIELSKIQNKIYYKTSNGILINANCIDILQLIDDGVIDVVFTDPPFMISQEMKIRRQRNPIKFNTEPYKSSSRKNNMKWKFIGKDINYDFGHWDKFRNIDDFLIFTKSWFDECCRVLRKSGHILSFFDKYKISFLCFWGEQNNILPRQCLFLKKTNPVPQARCLVGDCLILNENGIVEIENNHSFLIDRNGKMICGDKTERQYSGKIISIRIYNIGFPLKLTPEHLIYSIKLDKCNLLRNKGRKCLPKYSRWCPISTCVVNNGIKKGKKDYKCKRYFLNYEINWNRADCLKEGDYVIYPRKYEVSEQKYIDIEYYYRGSHTIREKDRIYLNKDLMRLLGFYLAEGSILGKTNAIAFYFSLKEYNYCREVKKIIEKYFDCNVKITKKLWKYEVRCENAKLRSFLEVCCNKLAYHKKINKIILNQSLEYLFELVWSFWQGDGCIVNSKTKYIDFSTISPHLAGQVFLILIRLGYCPKIRKLRPVKKFSKNEKECYRISIAGQKQVENFLNRKIIKSECYERDFVDEQFVYIPIRKIEIEDYSGKVYCYKSNGDFLTLNGIVHNCVSFMSAVEMVYWGTKEEINRKNCVFNWQLGQHSDFFEIPDDTYSYPIVPTPIDRLRHPTEKPIEFIKKVLLYLTRENDIVLDCFAGSGTLGVACEELNRRYILIEQDEEWCKISKKRIEKITNQIKFKLY